MTEFIFGELCNTPRDRGRVIGLPDVPEATKSQEFYTSIFRFGPDFLEHTKTGSISGFKGSCRACGIHADFDSPHDDLALQEGRLFIERALAPVVGLVVDDFRFWFSGNKGVHLLARSCEIDALTPSEKIPDMVKKIAASLARGLSTWDPSVYDMTRIFRMANSRHPKSGLYKIELLASELWGPDALSWEQIRERAKHPRTRGMMICEAKERLNYVIA